MSSEAGEAHDEHRAHYPISLGLWGFATLCGLLLPQVSSPRVCSLQSFRPPRALCAVCRSAQRCVLIP